MRSSPNIKWVLKISTGLLWLLQPRSSLFSLNLTLKRNLERGTTPLTIEICYISVPPPFFENLNHGIFLIQFVDTEWRPLYFTVEDHMSIV